MILTNGTRVLHLLTRRCFSSTLVQDLTNQILRGVSIGSFRRLNTGAANPSKLLGDCTSKSGDGRKWISFGDSNFGSTRSIHGTGSTFMSAKDYYEVLGVSKNAPEAES